MGSNFFGEKNMVVLVTGGAGFIGSNFIRYIFTQEKYIKVVNLDALTYASNFDNVAEMENDSRYKFIQGDISNKATVEHVIRKYQPLVVVNFAAESHVDRSINDATDFIKSNIVGTSILLDASRKYNVSRFLQVSTDEVYGSLGLEDSPSKEDDNLLPNSPYSASKASADLLVRSYINTYGFPAIITRCSNNYGPYMHPEKFIPLFITNALDNKPCPLYGTGKNIRDWIYVEDHCRGIWDAAKKGRVGQIYNFGGGNQIENIEVAETIMDILNKPKDLIVRVDDRLGHDFRYDMNYEKARGSLGWIPKIPFYEGLKEMIGWYKDNKKWWLKLKK